MSASSFEDLPTSVQRGREVQNALELPSRVLTGRFCEGSVVLRQPLPSVVEERRGLLILVEQSSFRAFHHDLHEEGDAFLTLLRGKKLWLMCNLSNVARELDRLGRDRREAASRTLRYLQSLKKTMAKQVFWVLLEPGQSLYLPYGWLHSVWTDVEEGRICPMFSVEMSVDEERAQQQLTLANKYTAVACRRQQPGSSQQN